jgi:hypothetical protein
VLLDSITSDMPVHDESNYGLLFHCCLDTHSHPLQSYGNIPRVSKIHVHFSE